MREIKFRVWDNIMIYDNFCAINADPKFVMQYTGLKDENGKEIYEGDIVLLHGYYRTDVRFKDGMFILDAPSNQGDFEEILYNRLDTCKVIGNIYENLELLNDPE
jgi:hypothetical protein